MKPAILMAFAATLALAGCGDSGGANYFSKYQASVAYHKGDELAYTYGSRTTREECVAEARAIMEQIRYRSDSDSRVDSWVCLVWNGNDLVSKVR